MPDPISWAHAWPYLGGALLASYLLGAIPFGLVLTRLAGLGDLRQTGSGNIGATNVLRTGRKDLAAATVLLDGGKGAAAVLLAQLYGPDAALMAALGSVLGHLFPVWLKFRGGKGVTTTLGVLLALAWPVGVSACLSWLVVAAAARMSSAASLAALALSPLYAWIWMQDLQLVQMTALLAALVWFSHRQNIGRILKGEEPRIGRGR